jgi:hypothetical protein
VRWRSYPSRAYRAGRSGLARDVSGPACAGPIDLVEDGGCGAVAEEASGQISTDGIEVERVEYASDRSIDVAM